MGELYEPSLVLICAQKCRKIKLNSQPMHHTARIAGRLKDTS